MSDGECIHALTSTKPSVLLTAALKQDLQPHWLQQTCKIFGRFGYLPQISSVIFSSLSCRYLAAGLRTITKGLQLHHEMIRFVNCNETAGRNDGGDNVEFSQSRAPVPVILFPNGGLFETIL